MLHGLVHPPPRDVIREASRACERLHDLVHTLHQCIIPSVSKKKGRKPLTILERKKTIKKVSLPSPPTATGNTTQSGTPLRTGKIRPGPSPRNPSPYPLERC